MPSEPLSFEQDRKLEHFLEDLREKIGLLAPRGDRQYSFLHLTFQEYLAARFLLPGRQFERQELEQRLGDPRWREPILLALGYAGWMWPAEDVEALVETLLSSDDPLGDLIPRSALLIVEALPEIKGLGRGTVHRILRLLLQAYSDLRGQARLGTLLREIEDAFLRLRRHGIVETMDAVFCEALLEPVLASAAAALVREQGWFSPKVVATLVDAVDHDTADWDWPIVTSLRELVSPEVPRVQAKEPKPPSPAELSSLRAEKPTEAERWELLYEAARSVYERGVSRASLALRAPLPDSKLILRSFLASQPGLVERIRGSSSWLRLLLALCGGYEDRKADEIEREYCYISEFLQQSDTVRKALIDEDPESYVGYGDDDDPVYAMAVYLDTKMAGRQNFASAPLRFEPAAIFRDPRLTELIRLTLEAGQEPHSLIQRLWQTWRLAPKAEDRAEALIALVSLGEPVTEEIESALGTADASETARRVLHHLAGLATALRDPIARARPMILQSLRSLEVPVGLWNDLVLTLLRVLVSFASVPINTTTLTERATGSGLGAVLRADVWVQTLSWGRADRVYDIAVLIDTMPSPDDLIALLSAAHASPHRRFSSQAFAWETDPLPPRFRTDPMDIPLEALNALEGLRIDHIRSDLDFGLRTAALTRLATRAAANPDLLPELLIIAYPSLVYEIARPFTSALPADFFPNPIQCLGRMARDVGDPYYRVRAMVRLLPYSHLGGMARSQIVQDLLAAVPLIQDPFRRARAWELLIPVLRVDNREDLVADALAAARSIEDPDDRARVLARMSFLVSADLGAVLRREAVAVARRIADLERRSETLQALRASLPWSEFDTPLRDIAAELDSPWASAKILDSLRQEIVGAPPEPLARAIADQPEIWAPVLLGAAVGQVLDYFRRDADVAGIWAALARTLDVETHRQLLQRGAEQGLVLTHDAAQALNTLILADQGEIVQTLLPLVQNPTPQARPFVESWVRSKDESLRHHAVLYLAEDGRKLDAQSIPSLIALLLGDSDRSRHRAFLTFGSRVLAIEKQMRGLSVARLGFETVNLLVREALRLEWINPIAALRVRHVFSDMTFDSPEILSRWAALSKEDGDAANEAVFALENIEHLSDETWDLLLHLLRSEAPHIKKALLQSLCRLANLKKAFPDERWEKAIPVLRELNWSVVADHYILPAPQETIVKVLRQLRDLRPENIAGAAEALLDIEWQNVVQIQDLSDTDLRARLGQIGSTLYRHLDGSDPEADTAADEIEQEPELFVLLLRWLEQSLSIQLGRNPEKDKRERWLLTIAAAVARRMPSDLALLARGTRIRPLLIDAARLQSSPYGRRAAVVLLSLLRQVDPDTTDVLLAAMRDDGDVRQAALAALGEFIHFEGDVLTPLLTALSHGSAATAFGGARLLSLLGRHERTSSEQRRKILEALAARVKDPAAQRGVYSLEGLGTEDDPVQIRCLVQLDAAFYQALVEVAGLQ